MLIYEKAGYIQVSYCPTPNYILFDWIDFFISLEDIMELHQKALRIAQEKHCYIYVAETSKVNTLLRPEVIKWWGEEWVPKIAEGGIQGIITVLPKSVIASLSTDSWQSKVVNDITMKNVKTIAEAEGFIELMHHE